MPRIILFKTPPTTDQPDHYEFLFNEAGFEIVYVPVLKEEYQVDGLSRILSGSDDGNWAGVVITSKRGAEGWVKAADACHAQDTEIDWSQIPLFTVGTTSLDHLSTAQNLLRPTLRLCIEDSHTAKSATELLPLLLSDNRVDGRYLIIRGDKSTNELQEGLRMAGVGYVEVEVYSTSARVDLGSNLKKALSGTATATATATIESEQGEKEEEGDIVWLAFFSPSSAELVLSILGDQHRDRLATYLIAAIGGTTERYLVERGLEVQAVADQPTPEGLLGSILAYRREHKVS